MSNHKVETIAIHAGNSIDSHTGAVMPAIHLSTTFKRGNDGEYVYGRTQNPNRRALENCLAALANGADAAAFASGMAAISAVFQALQPGDHVIIPNDVYFGMRKMIEGILGPWGLAFSAVDMSDLAQVEAAMQANTRLVWVETPSNPMLKITDVAAIAGIARQNNTLLAVDATWPTPLLQPSFALGADLTIHSTTKYLGGHSDMTGGAVIAKKDGDLFARIRHLQQITGAVPSPFDCWLLRRGISTLPYRMQGHCENGQKVAHFLDSHPTVCVVHYPGLAAHPGHEIAKRQMSDFGGMVSFQVKGGKAQAAQIAASTRLFTQATSLGGVESLIEHRAVVEGPDSPTPVDLLRLSVGLEHADDLIADLDSAMR